MSEPGLRLERIVDTGFANLRGDARDAALQAAVTAVAGVALPTAPNTVAMAELHIYWLGPDEWLLQGAAAAMATATAELQAGVTELHAAVNDLSGGMIHYRISGSAAADLLAKGCTLDLHGADFGPGQCAQTGLAKAGIVLVPLPDGASYELLVRRSFADYLWQWLLHAGRNLGIEVA